MDDFPGWLGSGIMILLDVLAVSLLMSHEQKQQRRILRMERQRLEAWAEIRAEEIAEEKITEKIIAEKLYNPEH